TGFPREKHGQETDGRQPRQAKGEAERPPRCGAYSIDVQQYDRLDHRSEGRRARLGERRVGGIQRYEEGDALRCADGGRERGAQVDGAWPQAGGRLRQGARLGPRDGDPVAPVGRAGSEHDQGRDPDPAQRLPATQAAQGLTPEEATEWRYTTDPSAGSAGGTWSNCF